MNDFLFEISSIVVYGATVTIVVLAFISARYLYLVRRDAARFRSR